MNWQKKLKGKWHDYCTFLTNSEWIETKENRMTKKEKHAAELLAIVKGEQTRPGGNKADINLSASKKLADNLSSFERINPADLKENKNNPFEPLPPADFERLKADIEKDGVLVPLLIDKDRIIIDGNNRRRAAIALSLPLVPVFQVESNLTQAEIRHISMTLQFKRRNLTQADIVVFLVKEYPEYMESEIRGGDKKSEKSKPHGASLIEAIMAETGFSIDKIQRAKQLHKQATEQAKKEGRKKAERKDIQTVKKKKLADRKDGRTLPDKRTDSQTSANKQIVLQDAGLLNGLKTADLKKFQNKTLLLYRSAKPQERNNFKAKF